jgi:hypothetical protein
MAYQSVPGNLASRDCRAARSRPNPSRLLIEKRCVCVGADTTKARHKRVTAV